jgi:hypothetical protein
MAEYHVRQSATLEALRVRKLVEALSDTLLTSNIRVYRPVTFFFFFSFFFLLAFILISSSLPRYPNKKLLHRRTDLTYLINEVKMTIEENSQRQLENARALNTNES